MYTPENFVLQELVPPELFHAYPARTLWRTFDPLALLALQRIRDYYGPLLVNNWHRGGERKYSGLRPFDCPVGAALSIHKFARAFDCIPLHTTPEDIRADMRREPFAPHFEHVLRCESGVSWLHIDRGNVSARQRTEQGIVFFEPA